MKKRIIENEDEFIQQNKKSSNEMRKTTSNIGNLQEIFPQSSKESIVEALNVCEDITEVTEYLLNDKSERKEKGKINEKDKFKELIQTLKLNEYQATELIIFLNVKDNLKHIPKIEKMEEYLSLLRTPYIKKDPFNFLNEVKKPKKEVIPLDFGVMLLKDWLDENEQMGLYYLVKKHQIFFIFLIN